MFRLFSYPFLRFPQHDLDNADIVGIGVEVHLPRLSKAGVDLLLHRSYHVADAVTVRGEVREAHGDTAERALARRQAQKVRQRSVLVAVTMPACSSAVRR